MNSKKQLKVAGLGEVLWDCFADAKQLGGAPTNFARHVNQLGIEGYPVSCVGTDEIGAAAKEELVASGVKVDYLYEHPTLRTGTVQVTLDENAKPSYQICQNVAWDSIPCSNELFAFAKELDAVCFGTLSQRSSVSRQTIRKFMQTVPDDALKVLDVNLREPFFSEQIVTDSLECANVLKLSDEELSVLAKYYDLQGDETQQLQQLVRKFQLRLVACTKGADGSVLVTPDEVNVAKATPVKAIDSVGAGDSFNAAICTGLLHGFSLSDCNRFANQVAAYVCSHQGACPRLPDELRTIPQTYISSEPS